MITGLIVLLILILIIVLLFIGIYIYIKSRMKKFTIKYFGTSDLKKAIEVSEIEASNTPKSVSSMENLSLDMIKKDFPDLNINELKSMVEKSIIDVLSIIEKKEIKKLENNDDKVNAWINSKIEDLNSTVVHFDSIKFHRTVINKYEKNDGIATIYFVSTLEYFYKIDNKIGRKIQDRFKLEYIYVIDESKVNSNLKDFGINCPNCGAPITTLGNKICSYCGVEVNNIVKKTWKLNNISQF